MTQPAHGGASAPAAADLQARLEQAEARNRELESRLAAQHTLRCKVSEKGAVSVYGLNARWPVTLYAGQWERLAAYMPSLLAFMAEHRGELSTKSNGAA